MPNALPDPPPEPVAWRDVPHGRVLLFAPHPDDEVAGPGGALALHRRAGDPVRVVVATDGIDGDPDRRFDPATYALMRRQESAQGLHEVGVDDVVFWGFPDGQVLSAADVERGVRTASAALQDFHPDVVYLPWRHEGHPDHHALHHIVVAALARTAFAGLALGYEVWNAMLPDVLLDVTPVVEQKRRAMLAHRSQLAYVRYDHALLGLSAYRSLVHQRGQGYAEAFCVVQGPLPGVPAAPGR
ncbi:MAG: PIG-L family deacetylase [Planctomycetes bacterium]|nr:PIG-L family deacetylase [Planctomycetota bacterium]